MVSDTTATLPEDEVMGTILPEQIEKALAMLDEREREIIKLRFGLNDSRTPLTLEEVGEHFCLTRERIRQLEARAMSKLRHPANKDALSGLL